MTNIFKTEATMTEDRANDHALLDSIKAPRIRFPVDTSIAVAMTPEQDRMYRATSYPASDAMSVVNLERPRFGHKV